MPAFGRMPTGFVEGQQQLSAREMTNWVLTTRALAATSGLSGATGYRGAGGASTAVRPTAKYPVLAMPGLVWVRVTGYDNPNNPTVYRGRRVSPDIEGELTDPQGFKWSELDEEDIDLHIVRGTPYELTDVRAYWPRLLSLGTAEWWGWATAMALATADEVVERLYIVPPFGAWCEDEARPGAEPDFPPKPPVEPFPPGVPVLPEDVVPVEGPFRPPGGPPAPGRDDDDDEPSGCGGGYAG